MFLLSDGRILPHLFTLIPLTRGRHLKMAIFLNCLHFSKWYTAETAILDLSRRWDSDWLLTTEDEGGALLLCSVRPPYVCTWLSLLPIQGWIRIWGYCGEVLCHSDSGLCMGPIFTLCRNPVFVPMLSLPLVCEFFTATPLRPVFFLHYAGLPFLTLSPVLSKQKNSIDLASYSCINSP